MPILPIKSSITAQPASHDVSAVIRSMRGHFLNLNADQNSRLQVGQPHTVYSQLTTNVDSFDHLLSYFTTTGAKPSQLVLSASYTYYLPAAGYAWIRTRAKFVGEAGKTTVYTQKFSTANFSTSYGVEQQVRVGFFLPSSEFTSEQDEGFYWQRHILANGTDTVSLNYNVGPTILSIPQDSWNIDQLQTTQDISNNPSRCQIIWDRNIELCVLADLPDSLLFGFFFDGIFLPAHRFYAEDLTYAGANLKPMPAAWVMFGADVGQPTVIPRGISVVSIGENEGSRVKGGDNSGLITVAAGSTTHMVSISTSNSFIDTTNYTPVLKSVEASATTGPLVLILCRNATTSLTTAWGTVPGQSTSFMLSQRARGTLVEYGRLVNQVTFFQNGKITEFGNYDILGDHWSSHSGVYTNVSDTFDVFIFNPTAGDIDVIASMSWDTSR